MKKEQDKGKNKSNEKLNIHEGHRNRIRKKLNLDYNSILEDHEILEVLLFYSLTRRNTNDIAHYLLDEFDTLFQIFNTPEYRLVTVPNIGEKSSTLIAAIDELMKRMEEKTNNYKNINFNSWNSECDKYITDKWKKIKQEGYYAVWINKNGTPIFTQKIDTEIKNFEKDMVSKNIRMEVNFNGIIVIDFNKDYTEIPSSFELDKIKALSHVLKISDFYLYEYYRTNGKSLWKTINKR